MPVVRGGEGAVGEFVAGAGAAGLVVGEVGEGDAGRDVPARVAVQQLRREVRALPVLLPARHDQPRPGLPQPPRRAPRPLREAVGEDRGHLLGTVEEEEQGAAGVPGQPGQAFGGDVAEVGVRRGRDDPGGPAERAARRVGHRVVGGLQVGTAQPEGGGGGGATVTAGGEGREFRRTTTTGRPDEPEHGGVAVGECGELPRGHGSLYRPRDVPPPDMTGQGTVRPVLAH